MVCRAPNPGSGVVAKDRATSQAATGLQSPRASLKQSPSRTQSASSTTMPKGSLRLGTTTASQDLNRAWLQAKLGSPLGYMLGSLCNCRAQGCSRRYDAVQKLLGFTVQSRHLGIKTFKLPCYDLQVSSSLSAISV